MRGALSLARVIVNLVRGFSVGHLNMTIKKSKQDKVDERIRDLHLQAIEIWPRIEAIIDELKSLGPHSIDGENALINTREWLRQLSKR